MNENQPTHVLWTNKIMLTVLLIIAILSTILIPGIGALIPMVIALVSAFAAKRCGSFSDMGFRSQESWLKTISLALVVALILQLATLIIIEPLFTLITGKEVDVDSFRRMRGNFSVFLIYLAIGWGVGGFLEEFAFRGWLISRVWHLLGKTPAVTIPAVLLSAIPFGLAHMYQG